MKIATMILLLLIPTIGSAQQDFQGMSEKDMQKMMQQMQKMEACMQQVDQKKLQALEQRAQQIEAELKSLCASGKRDAAQAKAIAFEKEMENNPAMKTVKKCGEIMKDGLPNMPLMDLDKNKDDPNQHVCD
jgi:predicted lipoprotein